MADPYAAYSAYLANQQRSSQSMLDMFKYVIASKKQDEAAARAEKDLKLRQEQFAAGQEQRKFVKATTQATKLEGVLDTLRTIPWDDAVKVHESLKPVMANMGVDIGDSVEPTDAQLLTFAKTHGLARYDPKSKQFVAPIDDLRELAAQSGYNASAMLENIKSQGAASGNPFTGWDIGMTPKEAEAATLGAAAIEKKTGKAPAAPEAAIDLGTQIKDAIGLKKAATDAGLYSSPVEAIADVKAVFSGELGIAQALANSVQLVASGSPNSIRALSAMIEQIDMSVASMSQKIEELAQVESDDSMQLVVAYKSRIDELTEYRDKLSGELLNERGYSAVNRSETVRGVLEGMSSYYESLSSNIVDKVQQSASLGFIDESTVSQVAQLLGGRTAGITAELGKITLENISGNDNVIPSSGIRGAVNDVETAYITLKQGQVLSDLYDRLSADPELASKLSDLSGVASIGSKAMLAELYSALPASRLKAVLKELVTQGLLPEDMADALYRYKVGITQFSSDRPEFEPPITPTQTADIMNVELRNMP